MREYTSVADQVSRQTPRGSVLDWGCGFGHVSDMLIRRGVAVTAFEYDPAGQSLKPLERYPHILAHHSAEPVALEFPDGQFDSVLSCGVLEHVPDPAGSLAEIARVLKPGGKLFVFKLAHRYSYLEVIAKRLGLYYHGKYPNDRLYTLGQARALLEGSGYRIQEIRRTNMLPLSMLRGAWGERLAGPIWAFNRLLSRVPVLNLLATNVELVAVPTELPKTPSLAPVPSPGLGTAGRRRLGSFRAAAEMHVARARWAGRSMRSPQGRKYLVRAASFLAAKRISPVVAVDSDGVRYFVSSADQTVGAGTYVEGHYELDVMAYAIDLVTELTGRPALTDRTFVDIGANIGTTTLPAVTKFGAALAVAFEPVPEAFRLLKLNVTANDLESRIRTVNTAVSNTTGTAVMEVAAANMGDNRVRMGDRVEDGAFAEGKRSVVKVPMRRFDELALELDLNLASMGLVWIDTQGHEGQVLDGATSILKSSVPIILEYWPYGLRRADGLDLLHRLIEENYRTVVDLRASQNAGQVVRLDAAAIRELESHYCGLTQTDILLLS